MEREIKHNLHLNWCSVCIDRGANVETLVSISVRVDGSTVIYRNNLGLRQRHSECKEYGGDREDTHG